MLRLAVVLALLATPALAAEPSFTEEDVQAAFTRGVLVHSVQQAKSALDEFNSTPAARSLDAKLKPAPTPPKKP